jgi:hypothetical protein
MFGRRRHVAVVPAAPLPVPQLTDAQILELVHGKMAEFIGVGGEWSVIRRSAGDTDTLFTSILVQSVSVGIAAAITDARRRLEAGTMVSEPQHLADGAVMHVASPTAAPAPEATTDEGIAAQTETVDEPGTAVTSDSKPVAFTWEPAPITVWTDLRKPVSGTIPSVADRTAA